MPSSRKPASASTNHSIARRSGTGRGRNLRPRAAAIAIVTIVALVVAYLALRTSSGPVQPTGCVAGPRNQAVELSIGQAEIAATIAGVASARSLPSRAVAVAYATAWQESKLTDLHSGDLDSVGIFQQRPSEGWGTAKQIEDPVYATDRFFTALTRVPRYRRIPIAVAAQDVQHSADGSAYGQYAAAGTAMAVAFTGSIPHAVSCSYGSGVGKPHLQAATRSLRSAFGLLAASARADPAESVSVASARQGWAVAAWLVSHAATFGIRSIRYQSFRWLSTGAGHWTAVKNAGHRQQAASAAVVFG